MARSAIRAAPSTPMRSGSAVTLPVMRTALPGRPAACWVAVSAPVRVGDGLRLAAGQHVQHAPGGGGEGGRGRPPAQPHQVRGQDDVRVLVQRMGSGRLGVEHVEADPRQPPGGEGTEDGVGVDEGAAAAVDQHGPRLDPGQEGVVDQVAGLAGQREVQGDDIAARGQVTEPAAAHVGRRLADRVVGQDLHAEGPPQLRGPLADAAEADHAQGGVPEVAHRDPRALRPAALAHQRGERAEPLDQVQRHADRALGHRGGPGAGGDHHGDAPGRRGRPRRPARRPLRSGRRP